MKYQFYVITPDPEPTEQPVYRMFMVPTEQRGDQWHLTGDAVELDDSPEDIFMDVMAFRLRGMPDGFGSLDDIKPPRGWTVVARGWLPDDYKPPTEAEREQIERDAMAHWRKIQEDMKNEP